MSYVGAKYTEELWVNKKAKGVLPQSLAAIQ